MRGTFSNLPDNFHLFFILKFWVIKNNFWNIKQRLVFSYKIWPWSFLKWKQDVKPFQIIYTDFFFDHKVIPQTPARINSINIKHKIKINIKQMRSVVRRIFFLNNKNNKLNYFIHKLLKHSNSVKRTPINTLNHSYFGLLCYFIGFNNLNVQKISNLTHFRTGIKLPISKYIYTAMRTNWNSVLKLKKQIYYLPNPNFEFYKFTLKTHRSIRRLWFWRYIFFLYEIPRNIEVDFLTLSIIHLPSAQKASYVWYGYIAHIWWAFFSYYNWKFFH